MLARHLQPFNQFCILAQVEVANIGVRALPGYLELLARFVELESNLDVQAPTWQAEKVRISWVIVPWPSDATVSLERKGQRLADGKARSRAQSATRVTQSCRPATAKGSNSNEAWNSSGLPRSAGALRLR